jgi:hypothetical protein
VQELCARLQSLGASVVTEMAGFTENVSFRLPPIPAPRTAAGMGTVAPERAVPPGSTISASRHR